MSIIGCAAYHEALDRYVEALRNGTKADERKAVASYGITHQDSTAQSCFEESMRRDAWSLLSSDERRAYNAR